MISHHTNEPRSFLVVVSCELTCAISTYHARAGKGIPAQANSIALFNLVPLVFESFVIHFCKVASVAGVVLVREWVICWWASYITMRKVDARRGRKTTALGKWTAQMPDA
jgi:hypothetical protein